MGWSNAITYAKALAANHGIGAKPQARIDDGLPLGGRIGGLLKVQLSPFIRANASGALVAIPLQSDELICAVSLIKLDLGGCLHRYYLALGDKLGDVERFLEVYTSAQDENQGKGPELLHCTRLIRFIPETAEDQASYTGEAGAGLGEASFTLWREQMAVMGVDPILLASAFGELDSLDYQRDAGSPSMAFVAPFSGTETRIDDAYGETGLKQSIVYMRYRRTLANGDQECLVITTEIVEEQNGQPRREIHVDFAIGLPVEEERITIL